MSEDFKEYLQESDIARLREQEKLKSLFLLDMAELMKDKKAQDFIIYLLDFTNINGNNYTGNNDETNHRLGRASVGFHLLGLMEEVDPTLYPRILLNHAKERANVG
jgi:hypothetical protein